MNIKNFQPFKILILNYCFSLIILAFRDTVSLFAYVPLIILILIIPISVTIIVLLLFFLKMKKKWIYTKSYWKELNVFELIGAIILEGAFIFGLFLAWFSFEENDVTNVVLFIIIAIISNLIFIGYLVLWIKNKIDMKIVPNYEEKL